MVQISGLFDLDSRNTGCMFLGYGQGHWRVEHCVCCAGDRVQGVDLMSGIMKVLLCPLFTEMRREMGLEDVSILITFLRPRIRWRLGQGLHLIPKPELPGRGRSQHKAHKAS